ncbi:hypothetical protein MRB53_028733 [Persea americana]|uniref:Uncharacterized protein n=1 Tax=Persea americana TaxID=3435 RepID=A0ACC2KGW8_PERAE|nr:hypothetical protein MRB53_028733 [Persea americana]
MPNGRSVSLLSLPKCSDIPKMLSASSKSLFQSLLASTDFSPPNPQTSLPSPTQKQEPQAAAAEEEGQGQGTGDSDQVRQLRIILQKI